MAIAPKTLAESIPAGQRAITIGVQAIDAAGGMIRPGDRVDIIATFSIPQEIDGRKETQSITTTLFQNVKVLAVGDELAGSAEVMLSAAKGPQAPPRTRSAKGMLQITFAMSPMDAEVILAAMQIGKLKLILRGKGEAISAPLPPITPQQVLMKYLGLGGEEEAPKDRARIEVIRGSEVETVTVPKQGSSSNP